MVSRVTVDHIPSGVGGSIPSLRTKSPCNLVVKYLAFNQGTQVRFLVGARI